MSDWTFMNRSCAGWQPKTWMKLSAVCPYWLGHVTGHLEFMHEAWFRFYCSNHMKAGRYGPHRKRGGSVYRHGKLYKLYWNLHPEAVQVRRSGQFVQKLVPAS